MLLEDVMNKRKEEQIKEKLFESGSSGVIDEMGFVHFLSYASLGNITDRLTKLHHKTDYDTYAKLARTIEKYRDLHFNWHLIDWSTLDLLETFDNEKSYDILKNTKIASTVFAAFEDGKEYGFEAEKVFSRYHGCISDYTLKEIVEDCESLPYLLNSFKDDSMLELISNSKDPRLLARILAKPEDTKRAFEVYRILENKDDDFLSGIKFIMDHTRITAFNKLIDMVKKDMDIHGVKIVSNLTENSGVIERFIDWNLNKIKALDEIKEIVLEEGENKIGFLIDLVDDSLDHIQNYSENCIKNITKGYAELLDYMEHNKISTELSIFKNKTIRDVVEKYGNAKTFMAFEKIKSEELGIRFAKIVQNYSSEVGSKICKFIFNTVEYAERDLVKTVIKVFDKYKNFPQLIDSLEENKEEISFLNYHELLSERAYLSIMKNGSKVASNILKKDYSRVYNRIDDEEFANKIDYETMDYVDNLINLVDEVHVARIGLYKFDLDFELFTQLNRVISQADSYDGKLKIVKQYCNEVKDQMQDNVEDLMVVTK